MTDWNEAGRIQGRSDRPLSAGGRLQVRDWRLPSGWSGLPWRTSPLARATETASLLGRADATREPRLVETAWGLYEGSTLAELRARLGDAFLDLERRGLDFLPPSGESPRMVAARLATLLAELARRQEEAVLVTHKGVMRAALVLATGWDMAGPPPLRLARDDALELTLVPDGPCRPRRLSLAAS